MGRKDKLNKLIDEKMKEILLWWNKLDWVDRELILLKVYKEWSSKNVH